MDIRELADLCMLDMISVCLTTGKLGDVVAAALDKRERIILVLGKNGDVLPADYTSTITFLSALMTTRGWIDLPPASLAMARHSRENMKKRIRHIHQFMTEFHDDLQPHVL
jgi:hypothetical protein